MSGIRYWLLHVQYTKGALHQWLYNDEDEAFAKYEFAAFRANTDWVHLVEINHYYTPQAPVGLGKYLESTRQLVASTNALGARR